MTSLVWQQTPVDPDGGTYPMYEFTSDAGAVGAAGFCPALNLAGHQDWRLPTLIELVSLVDYTIAYPGPTLDPTYFAGVPGTAYSAFWSSTPVAGTPAENWEVAFNGGSATQDVTYDLHFVRCVREGVGPSAAAPGPAPAGRYTTMGTGTTAAVYDTKTLLTWQQTPVGFDAGLGAMTQAGAEAYCAGASFGGATGRLPTVNELLTLIDHSHAGSGVSASIDPTYFPGTPPSLFWSSTHEAGSTGAGSGWMVDFVSGGATYNTSTLTHHARCVR